MLHYDSPYLLRSHRGFTLRAFLLTITVIAVMIAVVYGGLAATLRPADKIDRSVEIDEAGPVLLKVISDDIAAAFVPPPRAK